MDKNISLNTTMNCGLNSQNEITYFAQLSHNEKHELFFRILWGKLRPSYYFDGLNNSEKDIVNIDQISFHKNGTVHIRYYDAAKNKEKIIHTKLQTTLLTMHQDAYSPLLILSIYDAELFKKYLGLSDSLIFDKSQNIQCQWEIQNTHQFSLVLFLVGGGVNCKIMLETHFPSIFSIAASPIFINYFGNEKGVETKNGKIPKVNDLGLLIGYTEKVIPKPPAYALVGARKTKEFNKI